MSVRWHARLLIILLAASVGLMAQSAPPAAASGSARPDLVVERLSTTTTVADDGSEVDEVNSRYVVNTTAALQAAKRTMTAGSQDLLKTPYVVPAGRPAETVILTLESLPLAAPR